MSVLVPICEFNFTNAAVRDARTDGLAWFPAMSLTLRGTVLCTRATSHGVEDGLHRVTLPGGATAWVGEAYPIDHPRKAA